MLTPERGHGTANRRGCNRIANRITKGTAHLRSAFVRGHDMLAQNVWQQAPLTYQ